MTALAPDIAPPLPSRPRYETAADWHRALGDVPLHRIIFDPWPGTATEADLLHYVERDKLCELIDGTLVEKPVGLIESIVAMNLATLLNMHIWPKQLGTVSGADSTLRMSFNGRVRLPDVCYFSADRVPGGFDPRTPIPTLSPDLAVEVLSHSNTAREIQQKLKEYFESGTRLAWIIDPPSRTVAIHHGPGSPTRVISANDILDGDAVLPGFAVKVTDLFRSIPDER
jgi:Uma2 family endonuclease